MPTNEKRREAAKRKLDRQLARRAERAKARRRYAAAGGAGAVILVVGVVVLIVVLSNRGQPVNAAAKTSPPAAPASPAPAASPAESKPAAPPVRPAPLPASVDCQYPETPQEPAARPVKPPLAGPTDAKGTVAATMQTSAGPVGLTLARALAPCTVNSFLSLTKQGFFANTPCHRLVTDPSLHVLQCGDPTGLGTGGPGYTIPDEVFPELTYERGYLAMANTGQPNSGGSQFFLVYGLSRLPASYTVFGTISAEGLKVIDQVAKAGTDGSRTPGDGKPKQPITITSIDIPAS